MHNWTELSWAELFLGSDCTSLVYDINIDSKTRDVFRGGDSCDASEQLNGDEVSNEQLNWTELKRVSGVLNVNA